MSDVGCRAEVWEQVLDELRIQIVLGELEPGSRLVETELAHRFGVSRGPVRTALQALEYSGLVDSSGARGVEVVQLGRDDIRQLFDVREVLEIAAVRRAAERSDADLVGRLNAHLDRLAECRASGEPVAAAEADLAFHQELCLAAGNKVLLGAWSNLADRLALVVTRFYSDGRKNSSAGAEHGEVVATIGRNDADGAERALRSHLGGAASMYRRWGRAVRASVPR